MGKQRGEALGGRPGSLAFAHFRNSALPLRTVLYRTSGLCHSELTSLNGSTLQPNPAAHSFRTTSLHKTSPQGLQTTDLDTLRCLISCILAFMFIMMCTLGDDERFKYLKRCLNTVVSSKNLQCTHVSTKNCFFEQLLYKH
mgnify:CR=1 FL=1